MNILIASATSLEIKPLLNHFEFKREINSRLSLMKYKHFNIYVLITGVGMVNTAYWLGCTLSKFQFDLAINLGIAGSYDKSIKLGEVVHIVSDFFPEMGAEDGETFLSLIDLKLLEQNEFPFNDGILMNETKLNSKLLYEYKQIKGATVNTVHGNDESINTFIQKHNTQVESMEGAAFFYACMSEKIACCQLRAVSNYVESRNKENWKMSLAINNLCNEFLNLLDE